MDAWGLALAFDGGKDSMQAPGPLTKPAHTPTGNASRRRRLMPSVMVVSEEGHEPHAPCNLHAAQTTHQ